MAKFVVNFSKYPIIQNIGWVFLTEGPLRGDWDGVLTIEDEPDAFEKKMSDLGDRIETLAERVDHMPLLWVNLQPDQIADELHRFEEDYLLMAEGARLGEQCLCNLAP